jgi:aminoglycoside phosphotransferase (APT) family kinase protein
VDITVALVRQLIAGQFPRWADLPVTPVAPGWLPSLAPQLPLPIPLPLALGAPAHGYPWPWSVYRWLPGEPLTAGRVHDLPGLATDLGQFLAALRGIDAAGGPPPGPHNFYRGGPLTTYDAETRQAIAALKGEIDADAATSVWDTALAANWQGPPVWFHGDVCAGNLLISGGRLGAVIDFGCAGVGDPACDAAAAWTLFAGESRAAFRIAHGLDDATWARGRGWALWKALITLAEYRERDVSKAGEARRVLAEVLAGADSC